MDMEKVDEEDAEHDEDDERTNTNKSKTSKQVSAKDVLQLSGMKRSSIDAAQVSPLPKSSKNADKKEILFVHPS
jgi:hypothetical protein